jgi:predicted nucleic acid-binding protein
MSHPEWTKVHRKQAPRDVQQPPRSHAVELADALIAAAASVTGLRLWTLNRRHYPMPDVRFYEPES